MSPSSRTDPLPQQAENQDTRSVRQRIVDAALELAQTIGVQAMSQARVATAAGVRQSHLTYYFPTRMDLIKATVHAISDQMLEATNATLLINGQGSDPVAELRNFSVREVCNIPHARLFLSMMVAAEEEPSLREWLYDFEQESIDQWLGVYRMAGLDISRDDIELFHATYVGATLLCAQTGTEAAIQRAARLAGLAFDRLVNKAQG